MGESLPETLFANLEFVVGVAVSPETQRPAVAVDGPVRGVDFLFDHHATGHPVNLDAIPDQVVRPRTIATTMVDTDAVLSAAVVILRAAGEHERIEAVWPVLYEAAHLCDHLIPSGKHPAAAQPGLGLHCWLKTHGLALMEVLAWAAGEVKATGSAEEPRLAPSPYTRARVFRELTRAMVTAIRLGRLPCDFAYLERLAAMEDLARQAICRVEGPVTLLTSDHYLDPLALYRVVATDLAVQYRVLADGGYRYSIGVHPQAYGRVDLRPLFARLSALEPGWGGRATAGGSPLEGGSRLCPDDLVQLLTRFLGEEASQDPAQ